MRSKRKPFRKIRQRKRKMASSSSSNFSTNLHLQHKATDSLLSNLAPLTIHDGPATSSGNPTRMTPSAKKKRNTKTKRLKRQQAKPLNSSPNKRNNVFNDNVEGPNSTTFINVEDIDEPSTSQGIKHSPFRKFRDDRAPLRKRQLKRLRKTKNRSPSKVANQLMAAQRCVNSPSAVQLVSKKLLRSIRRRHNQQNQRQQTTATNSSATPHNKRDILRRKLNFQDRQKAAATTSRMDNTNILGQKFCKSAVTSNSTTLEDCEKRPGKDEDKTLLFGDVDCVCIEKPIEQIVIDDDEEEEEQQQGAEQNLLQSNSSPSGVSKKSSGYVSDDASSNSQARMKLLASTPHLKLNGKASTPLCSPKAPGSPSYATVVAAGSSSLHSSAHPLFFEDTKPSAWFETINSEDTFVNYTLQSSKPLRERTKTNASKSTVLEYDSDIICVEDSTCNSTLKSKRARKRKSSSLDDDSVVFVSETNPNVVPFIPLDAKDVPNPIKVPREVTPKRRRPNNDLFTNSEKKQLETYNYNAYNPSNDSNNNDESSEQQPQSKKRMVIIDGSNVAFNHALNKEFSVKGLKICIAYFEKMGHEVKAVVPQFRLQRNKSSDSEELEKMHGNGKIVFTPCKTVPGKSPISYDDRFVLQLACELDAAVVSNDDYCDLILIPAFKKVVENRVVGYTWCNDIFILPKDPYGKWGPTLDIILNRS